MTDLNLTNAILLGILQGFTEWLPISSSGHLVIAQALLGISVPAAFDIVIMAGTIAALLIYFRVTLYGLACGFLSGEPSARKYFLFIVIAGIGTAILGFLGKPFFTGLFAEPFIVSLLIIVTGIFLLIVSLVKVPKGDLTPKSALVIGLAQGLAVAPGISRSGSTIGAALLFGIRPKEAAEFSFIIGIPAMIVASVWTFMEEPSGTIAPAPLVAAVIAAFVAGYVSIDLLMRVLKERRLIIFVLYCLGAGMLFAFLTFPK